MQAMTVREMMGWLHYIAKQQWEEQPSQESLYAARTALEVARIGAMLTGDKQATPPTLDQMLLRVTDDTDKVEETEFDEDYYNAAVTAVAKAALAARLGKKRIP